MQSLDKPTRSYWPQAIFIGVVAFLFLSALGLLLIWGGFSDCQPLSDLHTSYPDAVAPSDAKCFDFFRDQLVFFSVHESLEKSFRLVKFIFLVVFPLTALSYYWYARRRDAPKKT